jgi:hypothetical protein
VLLEGGVVLCSSLFLPIVETKFFFAHTTPVSTVSSHVYTFIILFEISMYFGTRHSEHRSVRPVKHGRPYKGAVLVLCWCCAGAVLFGQHPSTIEGAFCRNSV